MFLTGKNILIICNFNAGIAACAGNTALTAKRFCVWNAHVSVSFSSCQQKRYNVLPDNVSDGVT